MKRTWRCEEAAAEVAAALVMLEQSNDPAHEDDAALPAEPATLHAEALAMLREAERLEAAWGRRRGGDAAKEAFDEANKDRDAEIVQMAKETAQGNRYLSPSGIEKSVASKLALKGIRLSPKQVGRIIAKHLKKSDMR